MKKIMKRQAAILMAVIFMMSAGGCTQKKNVETSAETVQKETEAADLDATEMKDYFYPEVDKTLLFDQGYIDAKSGHSRGSTVDLTLFDMSTGKEVDMGGTFDYFGELSHPDYTEGLTDEQYANRMILREAMIRHGFRPLETEWWHFTLENEPYPDTYFDFRVNAEVVSDAGL